MVDYESRTLKYHTGHFLYWDYIFLIAKFILSLCLCLCVASHLGPVATCIEGTMRI